MTPLKTQVKTLKELGFTHFCGQFSTQGPGLFKNDLTDRQVEETQALLAESGLGVASWNIGGEYMAPAEKLADELRLSEHDLDLAAKFRPETAIVFAGWENRTDDAVYDQVGRALDHVAQHAARHGITIALENHGGLTATVEQIHRLFAPIKARNIGLNYDPANFEMYGVDPLAALQSLEVPVVFTHFKSVRRDADGKKQYCRIRDGYIDYRPIVAELRKRKYDGFWTTEYEDPSDVVEGTRDDLASLLALLGRKA